MPPLFLRIIVPITLTLDHNPSLPIFSLLQLPPNCDVSGNNDYPSLLPAPQCNGSLGNGPNGPMD